MRKVWNRPAYPVWSLVTQNKNGTYNMNICTYVSALAMEPKVMSVAVYLGTQTRDNCRKGARVRLQLLSESQARLVQLLGKQSGKTIDKLARLTKRGLVTEVAGLPLLSDTAGYIDMTITKVITTGYDHDLIFGEVSAQKSITDTILTTDYLKAHKLIR